MNAFEKGLRRYFSAAQLARIQRVSVGIAGAGGLGSNCAALLVRSGFQKLTIVDFDTVELSNLNRQFFFSSQLGTVKVEALADNLRRINPDLQLRCVRGKIEQTNLKELFASCDVLVEALDQAEMKAILTEMFSEMNKLTVAASGIAGCGASDRIKTRRIGKKLYLIGDFVTGTEQAVPYAPCVMIAAAKQADVILDCVLKGEVVCDANGRHAEF